ncbi:MAG TPA: hypothetical protein VGH38_05255 [Bryobacteraceae bacterium]
MPHFGGLLAIIAVLGAGTAFCRWIGPVPLRWRLAAAMVSGAALIQFCATLVLILGGGVFAIKLVGICALSIGCLELIRSRGYLELLRVQKFEGVCDLWFLGALAAAVALNLVIASAPSTKIDELYYHMLAPRRIIEDGKLFLYHEPIEAAIVPQMSFQTGLSMVHAFRFPEAGNVLSWALGAVLVLLIAGVVGDVAGSTTAGWMTGAIASVGVYPAVWHVTSGPHALGDLATTMAVLLVLLPKENAGGITTNTRLALVSLGSCAAALTKISLLPLGLTLTAFAAYQAAREIGWRSAVTITLATWSILYIPLVVWTTIQSGSPFGPITAVLFRSRFFSPETGAELEASRTLNQGGWLPLLRTLAPSYSIGVVAAFGVVAIASWKKFHGARILAGLVIGQGILIAWLLPHDFRFLGGLQYAVLAMAAWWFWRLRAGAATMRRWPLVLAGLVVPWLAVQVYYARPFVAVVAGLRSRDAFIHEYVAYADDFRALDRILPADAILYAVATRVPAYYAPRPIVFSLDDLHGRSPVYRFATGEWMDEDEPGWSCSDTVYENPRAAAEVHRTPGRPPFLEALKVQRCVPQIP